jgi:sulfur-carrier protein adenylyltransferase/sulfurtransferase
MALVIIPTPLRAYVQGQPQVHAAGGTVAEVLRSLVQAHGAMQAQLFGEGGQLRRFVNLFLNDDDIRLHDGLQTAVADHDRLEILPAIAGGISFPEWRGQLQQELQQLDVDTLRQQLASGQAPALLDVRTAEEWAQGHMPGARHLDRGFVEIKAETVLPDKQAPVAVVCESGTRSLFAALALRTLGYTQVANVRGGIKAWKEAGHPLVQPRLLSAEQRRRYLRHLAIPEVGEAGQTRLLAARVLCIGAGGLGCPVALYLAAAGVGTLGILDSDIVDESNLQRQVLHSTDRVGQPKTTSARMALQALNPDVHVIEHQQRLVAEDALALFQDYDLVIDGSDNFSTRYLVNDACVRLGKPFVHGSVFRFEGQVAVFHPGHGPCYRCLYPEPPPPELAPSCADAGVLGVLPGVIGVLQATEALKLLLGVGEPLIGRSLRFDALAGRFRELRYAADPHCACCGSQAQHGALHDEAFVCATA